MSDAGRITVLPLLDTSESVQGDRLRHLLLATRALLRGLKPGDTAGLLTFHETLSMVVPLAPVTPRAADITGVLAGVRATGSTALYDALYAGMSLAANDSGRSLLLLFSDGADTSSWLSRKAVEDSAQRLNVVVYVVVAGEAAASGSEVPAADCRRDGRAAVRRGVHRVRDAIRQDPAGVP